LYYRAGVNVKTKQNIFGYIFTEEFENFYFENCNNIFIQIFAGVTIAPAPSTTQLALATVEVRVKIKKILDTNRRKFMIFMLKKDILIHS
jgi:hypothetical protein